MLVSFQNSTYLTKPKFLQTLMTIS